jgi:RNA polymerase sporulation-specific sigma factor
MARSKKIVVKVEKKLPQKWVAKDLEALKSVKRKSVKAIESEILDIPDDTDSDIILDVKSLEATDVVETEDVKVKDKYQSPTRDMLEQIMFKLPYVLDPLIGTPKQVKTQLDALAKKMQRQPSNDSLFNKIHLYMHGYLINVVLKKFPFIKGYQTVDVYQETLIALRFKAIPNFKYGKGMSFLNFAKMCIRRHLITLLNAAQTIKKSQAMNRAISLDSSPIHDDDDDSKTTYANIIADTKASADKAIETSEAYVVTRDALLGELSDFEQTVLSEYLSNSSYREISKSISSGLKKKSNTKSIDNALLRIRKKATHLLKHSKKEDLPIFMKKGDSNQERN